MNLKEFLALPTFENAKHGDYFVIKSISGKQELQSCELDMTPQSQFDRCEPGVQIFVGWVGLKQQDKMVLCMLDINIRESKK